MNAEEVKLILQGGYFLLLSYVLRRVFTGIETRLDLLIKILSEDAVSPRRRRTRTRLSPGQPPNTKGPTK